MTYIYLRKLFYTLKDIKSFLNKEERVVIYSNNCIKGLVIAIEIKATIRLPDKED